MPFYKIQIFNLFSWTLLCKAVEIHIFGVLRFWVFWDWRQVCLLECLSSSKRHLCRKHYVDQPRIRVAELLGDEMADDRAGLLKGVSELPRAMETVLSRRDLIGEAARQFAPSRRYWAMVGSGPNRIAAQEVRVKLSELCYKSIAADSTEDKKHIDLSSEPLIFVLSMFTSRVYAASSNPIHAILSSF